MKTKRSSSAILSAFAVFKKTDGMKNKKSKRKSINLNSSSNSIRKGIEEEIKAPKKKRPLNVPQESIAVSAPEDVSDPNPVPCGSPEAQQCFEWLINPVQASKFFSDTWEKKPMHIRRKGNPYYKGVFSCKEFDKILRDNHLEFNKNIDVVSYINGVKRVHTADGRAYASVIWDYYQNGCSIRLLNPQTFSKPVWKLNSLLQEYLGSFVGTNMYLTPPGSQGFAPHYDDIEAFILQLEGKKQWKIYAPRSQLEQLPRYSSENFKEDEIGDPIMEILLEPGDLLYFPRGYIHQASTLEDVHSLHITLSTYQKNTWGDLLEKILPQALQTAMEENVEYRQSLPKDYLNYVGVVNTDKDTIERKTFVQKLIRLTEHLSKYLLTDTGADQMAKDFIHSSLPPCLTQHEKLHSIHANGEYWEDGRVRNVEELRPETKIRLVRKRAVRLIREESKVRLYHSLENSRVYQEHDPQYVEIDWELAPAVEHLIRSYPEFVAIEELPLNNLQEQMDIATLLYDKGLVLTEVPLLEASDEDEN